MSRLEKKIMVRCVRRANVVFTNGEDVFKSFKRPAVYACFDYYMVDLEDDEDGSVLEQYCEPLLDDIRGPGNLIYLESKILSVPLIRFFQFENIPPSFPYPTTGDTVNRLTDMFLTPLDEVHTHVKWIRSKSRLNKVHSPRKWIKSASVPDSFCCAALRGNIYGLISGDIKTPLCFNFVDNCWTESTAPPPPELYKCGVTQNMIPDPVHGRIFVHLESALYAWYPEMSCEDGSSWKCVEESFTPNLWVCGATLINFNNKSLLFFFFNNYIDLFRIWSLDDHKFMQVTWLNEFPRIELKHVHASSTCYLGNNQLCLALSFPAVNGDDYSRVSVLVFEIMQSTNTDARGKGVMPAANTDSITLTYVSTKTFRAFDCRYAVDLTPLDEVY